MTDTPRRARVPPVDSLDKGFCNQKSGWILDADAGWVFEADLHLEIEKETFKVLKGYNLEHNFGHGKQTLSNLLVSLNLLAFAFHTVANLCVLAWRTAVATRGAKYRFFEHLRTITAYIVFPNWHSLLTAIADPKAQPP